MTPSHAISIWLDAKGRIVAQVGDHEIPIEPSKWEPRKREHWCECPKCGVQFATEVMSFPKGLRGLIEILREREATRRPATIGATSNPVAHDVNSMKYLAEIKAKRRDTIKAETLRAAKERRDREAQEILDLLGEI